MHITIPFFLAISLALGAESVPAVAADTTAQSTGPHIVFDKTDLDFGKIESGELVKHTFTFTNTGNQTLEIREVRPSCGCTTAGAWDKQVEPGKSGIIPIQFNSAGYGGAIHKAVTVACNDPANSNVVLQITGTAWKPIDVTPNFVTFNLNPDIQTNETRVLRIVNNLEEPLTLSDPKCSAPVFQVELKNVKEGKEYELRVTVVPPLPTPTVSSPVTLKTSYPKMPVLSISAYAMVQPVVSVMPSQIMLAAGPLTNSSQITVTLLNNSTNPVLLSEPSINAEGAQAQLKELQPGRRFELTLTFPIGFQSQPGQLMEATVKSSSPQAPVIKVPVFQTAAPTKPAAPAATSSANTNTSSVNAQALSTLPLSNNVLVSIATNVPATPHGPKLEFTSMDFDFGRVASGTIVNHNFTFTNKGDQVLELFDVHSSCGCTAADNYSHRVEPGQSGSLPVIFNTSGMGGPVVKTLKVLNNDLENSNIVLQISATVYKPIDALPGVAAFTFGPDSQTNESRIVRLISNVQEPVTISEPVCTNNSFRASLKTVKPGKEFELEITIVPPVPGGSTVAPITLKTSVSNMPVVTVTAYAMVQPALSVTPPRLRLIEDPLTEAAKFTVRIQNLSTNSLVLSDPTVNAKGAEILLRELQPGRLFELTLDFPAGFRKEPGQQIEARLKSSHPQFPFITIPVLEPFSSSIEDKAAVGSALSHAQATPTEPTRVLQ